MYYYALINENNVCTAVYAMPAAISGASYVEITEEQYNDGSLIGKKYVNGEWVEVITYYYAILDERGLVETVYESQTEMPAANNMVQITLEQYNDAALIGKYYDRENNAFIVPPVSVLAAHSTDAIQYKNEETWLSDKLDEIEAAIANAGGGSTPVDAYTKAESDDKFATLENLANKADAEHSHTGYAQAEHTHTGYAAAEHEHNGYAAANHEHSEYAQSNHTHNGYAPETHTHSQNEVTGLASALAGKADTEHAHTGYAASNHSHSGYAASNHSHSNYFPTAGGTITGETNFSGGLVRAKGAQAIFHSGSQLIYGTNNLPTRIAGNAISATNTITVDSDMRLKDDVKPLDKEKLIDFMRQIELVSYRYSNEEEGTQHIGVIAQQLLDIDPDVAKYFVTQNEKGYYSVDYTALSLLALLALQ